MWCVQVLQTSGLSEPGLLALSSSPARLIFRLYEHPSITDRVRRFHFLGPSSSSSAAVLAGLPDIHSVADRIAAIGLVNVSKVRRTLLDQWLASNSGVEQLESADVTMVGEDDSGRTGVEEAGVAVNSWDDVDLLRAVYVLKYPGTNFDGAALTLVNYLCDTDRASSVSAAQQAGIQSIYAYKLPTVQGSDTRDTRWVFFVHPPKKTHTSTLT